MSEKNHKFLKFHILVQVIKRTPKQPDRKYCWLGRYEIIFCIWVNIYYQFALCCLGVLFN